VAEPVPVWVFSKLLGVPEERWHDFVTWSTAITAVGGGDASDEALALIYEHAGPYVFGLAAERKACPADDYLTAISQATIGGEPLDDAGVTAFGLSLFGAGSETTQSLLAGMAWCLLEHPDQMQAVFDDPSLIPNAVEETLRWWTPVRSMARSATTDVDVSGTTVAQGERVLLLYSAANRDPDVFDGDPEVFDITRSDSSKHLGFGFGEHFCLGAHLARREARATFEELVARYRSMELAGEPKPRRNPLINSFDELPVRLIPR
jgi:cytochrome P450